MADNQQGDVYLFQINDDGEINVEGGIVEMRGSLETSAYLSLWGGNEDDTGGQESTRTWWGNIIENEPSRKYVSRTQNLLQSLPLVTGNLGRVEDAAKRDLQWLLDDNVATALTVTATIPALNTLQITIDIEAQGDVKTITFLANWQRDIEANT